MKDDTARSDLILSMVNDSCRLMSKGITHVLIVRSTLERRLDPKFPAELRYQIVEVRLHRGHSSEKIRAGHSAGDH